MPTSSFRLPQFLNAQCEPIHRIRCPIHGFIHYSEKERKVLDHPIVQRLRYVKQLALTDFLYPSACHSRFEHSLGVMHVATLAFDQLAATRGDLLERTFNRVELFSGHPGMAVARQALRLAGLLHDIGHAPFSHAAESVIHKGADHENLTLALLKDSIIVPEIRVSESEGHFAPLSQFIDGTFFAGMSDIVAKILQGVPELPVQLEILKNLVSGEMDADRTDYLQRDSHHCGVSYGRFDYLRLIESLEVLEGEFESLEIALDRGGVQAFEALILARYQMNAQIYYHRVRRIYDLYLREYFRSQSEQQFDTPDKILAQNDVTAMSQIFQDAECPDASGHEWARRIRDRRHHRLIHETGESAKVLDVRNSKAAIDELSISHPDTDFLWDHTEKLVTIHKLLLPEEDDVQSGYHELKVVDAGGRRRHVAEVSIILKKVPRKFQVARIYADVEPSDTGYRDALKSEAQDYFINRRTQGA